MGRRRYVGKAVRHQKEDRKPTDGVRSALEETGAQAWMPRSLSTRAIVAPISAGESQITAPASDSAAFFDAAVPVLPAMIAPAWPIRRPGGAVLPAMKATTGLRTCSLM